MHSKARFAIVEANRTIELCLKKQREKETNDRVRVRSIDSNRRSPPLLDDASTQYTHTDTMAVWPATVYVSLQSIYMANIWHTTNLLLTFNFWFSLLLQALCGVADTLLASALEHTAAATPAQFRTAVQCVCTLHKKICGVCAIWCASFLKYASHCSLSVLLLLCIIHYIAVAHSELCWIVVYMFSHILPHSIVTMCNVYERAINDHMCSMFALYKQHMRCEIFFYFFF